jgi:hypothetical protein
VAAEAGGEAVKHRTEFRVVVKREGLRQKTRIYRTLRGAQRRLALYGPEPWLALGHAAEDLFCCDGRDCNCGAITWREHSDCQRAGMPNLEFARIESRKVGPWSET